LGLDGKPVRLPEYVSSGGGGGGGGGGAVTVPLGVRSPLSSIGKPSSGVLVGVGKGGYCAIEGEEDFVDGDRVGRNSCTAVLSPVIGGWYECTTSCLSKMIVGPRPVSFERDECD
jgi:hypothetical protein